MYTYLMYGHCYLVGAMGVHMYVRLHTRGLYSVTCDIVRYYNKSSVSRFEIKDTILGTVCETEPQKYLLLKTQAQFFSICFSILQYNKMHRVCNGHYGDFFC
jgi:hypothetical protein